MLKTVIPGLELSILMFWEPNTILLELELLELNARQYRSRPFKSRVPAVSVTGLRTPVVFQLVPIFTEEPGALMVSCVLRPLKYRVELPVMVVTRLTNDVVAVEFKVKSPLMKGLPLTVEPPSRP
jgi:hypothetical protein